MTPVAFLKMLVVKAGLTFTATLAVLAVYEMNLDACLEVLGFFAFAVAIHAVWYGAAEIVQRPAPIVAAKGRLTEFLRERGMRLACRLQSAGDWLFVKAYEGSAQEREDIDSGMFDDIDPDKLDAHVRAEIEKRQTVKPGVFNFTVQEQSLKISHSDEENGHWVFGPSAVEALRDTCNEFLAQQARKTRGTEDPKGGA